MNIRLTSDAACADVMRALWGIENPSHYVRNGSFAEDVSRIRQNPVVLTRFRSIAANIHVQIELRISSTLATGSLSAGSTRGVSFASWKENWAPVGFETPFQVILAELSKYVQTRFY